MIHNLKILPAYFGAVIRGDKKSEIRFNDDRGFQKGDIAILQEFYSEPPSLPILHGEPGKTGYSGREQMVEITYVTNYMQKPGYVVFCFTLIGEVTENGS